MDLRNKSKNQLTQNDPNGRGHLPPQVYAESAVNALEQRALLDVDSEP